ncbi:hypothetical protein DFH09DRAFT_1367820 [Mycena vulgaris]|nr:hypothetical protein DFH09DRAFT_1367820 [Mycena vulgaris]
MQFTHISVLLSLIAFASLASAKSCNADECVSYFHGGDCQSGGYISDCVPTCGGNCFQYSSFDSIIVEGNSYAKESLSRQSGPCDAICSGSAQDVTPGTFTAQSCTNCVIGVLTACLDCDDQITRDPDDAQDAQESVSAFVAGCNSAGLKVDNVTVDGAFAAAGGKLSNSNTTTSPAWVRAEDLAPDHVSHGELRIKVLQPHCADRIASVALRLELNEFGEVKHLRHGAVIPEIKKSDNQTLRDDPSTLYDYGPYDKAMSDPALWFVKAEERTVWSTEATLFENNPNFSRPLIKPFIVASPAVNYPPSFVDYRQINSFDFDLVKRHAYSDLGYHYTTVVNFIDGRTVHLPAGYTTFRPTSTRPLVPTPSSWNKTFSMYYETCIADLPETKETLAQREKCLPESLRSAFIAEITLEEGYTAQRDKPLKGRVTVHATNGSTQISDISLAFHNYHYPSWAVEHATTGGDPDFYQKLCQYSDISGVISADSSSYLFNEDKSRNQFYESPRIPRGSLTAAKPYLDFELPIPTTAVPHFSSHYSSTMGALALNLAVVYPRDAANCIRGVDEAQNNPDAESIMLKTEESLWDSYTVVGNPISSEQLLIPPERLWERTLHLQAIVPLDVLGDISAQQMEHYLTPEQPSPIILASPPPDHVAFSFARPVVTTEALVNTSARLMPSKGTFDPYQYGRDFADYYNWQEAVPDPAAPRGFRLSKNGYRVEKFFSTLGQTPPPPPPPYKEGGSHP